MVETEFMKLYESLNNDNQDIRTKQLARKRFRLSESQSQEIGSIYDEISNKLGVDFNKVVYGENGFMNTCYPDGFPDFKGDVIYSEKYWKELMDWMDNNKELTEWIQVSKAEHERKRKKLKEWTPISPAERAKRKERRNLNLTEYYWRNDDEIDFERIDSDEAIAAMCERIYEKSGFDDVIDFLQDRGYDIESVEIKERNGEFVPEGHENDYIYTDDSGEEYILNNNDFEGLKATIDDIYWQDDYSQVMDYLTGKDYLDEAKTLKEWSDSPEPDWDDDWQDRYESIENDFVDRVAGNGNNPVDNLDSAIEEIFPEDIYVAGYEGDEDYDISKNPEDDVYTKTTYIITNTEVSDDIINNFKAAESYDSGIILVTDNNTRSEFDCEQGEFLYKVWAAWYMTDLNLSVEEVKDLYADIIADVVDEDEWPEYDPDDYYPD